MVDGFPPSLETIVPVAKRLLGMPDDSGGVQNIAILAFWYLLTSVSFCK